MIKSGLVFIHVPRGHLITMKLFQPQEKKCMIKLRRPFYALFYKIQIINFIPIDLQFKLFDCLVVSVFYIKMKYGVLKIKNV